MRHSSRAPSQGKTKYTTLKQVRADEDDLVRRALAAYFRSGEHDQPSKGGRVAAHDGKFYVLLRSVRGLVAVYRIRAYDAVLKRLRRWPEEIEE